MPTKPKHPARPAATAKPGRSPAPPPRASLPPAESRWQRIVRYGWDKGGARGGRK